MARPTLVPATAPLPVEPRERYTNPYLAYYSGLPVREGYLPESADAYRAESDAYAPVEVADSAAAGFQADPQAVQAQIDALRELSTLAQRGFSRDEERELEGNYQSGAALARAGDAGLEQRRAFAGETDNRLAQQQAGQDAVVARSSFDRDVSGLRDARRDAANEALASLSGSIRRGSFEEASRASQLQDILNRARADFSTIAARQNAENQNRVSEYNAGTGEQHFSDTAATYGRMYEDAQKARNARRAEVERERAEKRGAAAGIYGVAGAVTGAMIGGPEGARTGWQLGSAGGGAAHDALWSGDEDE